MLPRMLPNDNFTKRSCAKKIHNSLIWLAVPRGVEPPTFGLGNRCSIQKDCQSVGQARAIQTLSVVEFAKCPKRLALEIRTLG